MKHFDEAIIQKKINEYIWNKVFVTAKEKKFISDLLKNTDVLVFGGVVREYVLNNFRQIDHRDIDLVVTSLNDNVKTILEKFLEKRNSFGGYKLKVAHKDVDLWSLNETWAIKTKTPLFEESFDFLPLTSFFNLNAVAFSIGKNKLFYSEGFKLFLENKILDIEFKPNPMPGLCILKTFEYEKKYKLKIAKRLSDFIATNFETQKDKFYDIQIKHYGTPKYSVKEILTFCQNLSNR